MTKKTINIGTSANARDGDTLRAAFGKVNENFNELYALTDVDSLTELAQDYAAEMFTSGTHSGITVEYNDTNNKINLTVTNNGTATIDRLTNNNKIVSLAADGSLTVPSPTSTVFTLMFAESNYVPTISKPTLTLTDTPWELHGEYAYTTDGRVAPLALDSMFPTLVNPGYTSGDQFTFDESIHGFPGYTLTVTLTDVVLPGGAGWTANIEMNDPPVYPSTINSQGAIKLTTNDQNLIFGTNGSITYQGTESELNFTNQIGMEAALIWRGGQGAAINNLEDHLVIGTNHNNTTRTWQFGHNGRLTLPSGGIIGEDIVTDNPTIELAPANPDVESQRLIIKGGGIYEVTQNGIYLSWNQPNPIVGDTVDIFVQYPEYANQTLYWWVESVDQGISDPGFGTVLLNESGWSNIIFTLDSDDAPFTVRVSSIENVYDINSIGAETLEFNASIVQTDHHLHLTTGDLTETSIFLGTDNHNVRTTTTGSIQITTPTEGTNVWEFDNTGTLTTPGDIEFNGGSYIQDTEAFYVATAKSFEIQTDKSNIGDQRWIFGTDGTLAVPSSIVWNNGGIPDIAVDKSGSSFAISTNVAPGDPYTWTFSNQSKMTFPNGAVIDTYADGAENQTYFWGAPGQFMAVRGMIAEGVYGGGLNINTDGNIGILAQNGESSVGWSFNVGGSITFPNGSEQTTAYTGNNPLTTVAKTGGAAAVGTATAITVTNSPNPNWTAGTGVFINGINFVIAVDGSGNATVTTINDGGTGHFVGETFGPLLGSALGGTDGVDDVFFEVTAIDLSTTTALDLTKSINKLTDGYYSLANGVEGQAMYLVRQTGSVDANIFVQVASARLNGTVYTDIPHYPFSGGSTQNVTMLIFTDGAWQSNNGGWD